MLRFAGGLHIVAGRIVVEAELDTGAVARRLRRDIQEVYGHDSEVLVVQGTNLRKGTHYVVRVAKDGDLISEAREAASAVLDDDPTLAGHPALAGALARRLDEAEAAFLAKG